MALRPVPVANPRREEVRFAHGSERQFASILDFYRVKWEYEPTSFPLRWDAGRVTEMITPDFYLPDMGLYLELTTLRQSLVTGKNRKLRRMRELYPEAEIRLLYRRDYHRLLAKYGFGPAAAEETGVGRVLFTAEEIASRVGELGRMISRDYEGKVPVLVGAQRGMVCFVADLMREISLPIELDFVSVSDYGSSGSGVEVVKGLDLDLCGRDVLLVQDIVDTGMTLNYLMERLGSRGPASLAACTLIDKRARRIADAEIRYIGFEVGDDFLVGYGLGHRERYRNLPYLAVLNAGSEAVRTKEKAPRNLALR